MRCASTIASMSLTTMSEKETEVLGYRLGGAARPGDVIALVGELGAGKTAFVRGLAAGLGVLEGEVASPTFTMVAEHRGRLPLYHIDLYRLGPEGPDMLPIREYAYGRGVTAVEWFDRLPVGALDAYLLVRIDYTEPGRRLIFEGHGARAVALLAMLCGDAQS
jgi:tRNA threonylcarbamoyladenosine biosynthesis protein TsaE